jgi:hypothetical protein
VEGWPPVSRASISIVEWLLFKSLVSFITDVEKPPWPAFGAPAVIPAGGPSN